MNKGVKIVLDAASTFLILAHLPYAISMGQNSQKLKDSHKAEAEINEKYNIESGTTLEQYTKGKTAWIREYNEAIDKYNSWKAECDEIWSWDSSKIARNAEKVYIPLTSAAVVVSIASVAANIIDAKNKRGNESKIEEATSFVSEE